MAALHASQNSVLSFECPANVAAALQTLAAKHALSVEAVVAALVLQPIVDQLSDDGAALDARIESLSAEAVNA